MNTKRYAKKTVSTLGHLSGNLCWILFQNIKKIKNFKKVLTVGEGHVII